MITINVTGRPAGAGSKSFYQGKCAPASKYQKPWQEAVSAAAYLAKPDNLIEAPIVIDFSFMIKRPKSHYLKSKGLKDSAPTTPPIDLDKLIRSTADALTGLIYEDDKQIVEITAKKAYSPVRSASGARIKIGVEGR